MTGAELLTESVKAEVLRLRLFGLLDAWLPPAPDAPLTFLVCSDRWGDVRLTFEVVGADWVAVCGSGRRFVWADAVLPDPARRALGLEGTCGEASRHGACLAVLTLLRGGGAETCEFSEGWAALYTRDAPGR